MCILSGRRRCSQRIKGIDILQSRKSRYLMHFLFVSFLFFQTFLTFHFFCIWQQNIWILIFFFTKPNNILLLFLFIHLTKKSNFLNSSKIQLQFITKYPLNRYVIRRIVIRGSIHLSFATLFLVHFSQLKHIFLAEFFSLAKFHLFPL